MTDLLENPIVGAYFTLEIEGKLQGHFLEVSGIGSETEVIEHKPTGEEGHEAIIQKIPGRLTWGDVTLKRGLTSNMDIWNWRQEVVEGKIDGARTNCSIIAYNTEGGEVARWNLTNAWPSKIDGPSPKSDASEIMMEEVTVVHEGIERTS